MRLYIGAQTLKMKPIALTGNFLRTDTQLPNVNGLTKKPAKRHLEIEKLENAGMAW